MRTLIVLMAATALTACGGAGPTTAGGSAAPGTGTAGTGTSGIDAKFTGFAALNTDGVYSGTGGSQTYTYKTDETRTDQYSQLYAGNGNKPGDGKITLSYSGRDGIYTLAVSDGLSLASTNTRFQDPAHRVNVFGTNGAPDLNAQNFRYVSAGGGTGVPGEIGSTYNFTEMFYQVPGTETKYVSLAGYLRGDVSTTSVTYGTASYKQDNITFERGAFAYGVTTTPSNIPTTGTGTFSGQLVGTMINSPSGLAGNSYGQWISGTSTTTVDFGRNTVGLALRGTVSAALIDRFSSGTLFIPDGSSFAANGTGTLSTLGARTFSGTFTDATFTSAGGTVLERLTPPTSVSEVVANRVLPNAVIAASSFDGQFYGPAAEEVGGGFRIIGGTPDQRIDIIGAFTGKKP